MQLTSRRALRAPRRSKPSASASSRNLAQLDTLQASTRSPAAISNGEILPLLEIEGVGLLVSRSPLAGGLLSGKYSQTHQNPANSRRTNYDFPIVDKERTWKILDVMAPIAQAHGCSPRKLSIAWLLAKPVVTSVIIGAKRLEPASGQSCG